MRAAGLETGWRWRHAPGVGRASIRRLAPHVAALAGHAEWAGLLCVASASVLLFGGVEERHLAPLELSVFLLMTCAVVRRWHLGLPVAGVHPVATPLLAMVALGVAQLLPVPAWLAYALAPGLEALHADLPQPAGPLLPLSAYPYATRLALLRTAAYCAFLMMALDALSTRARVRSALRWAAIIGTLVASYGLLNYLSGNAHLLWLPRRYYLDSVTGTYVNRNNFAALMILLLPALLACYWAAHHRARTPHAVGDAVGRAAFYLMCGSVLGLALLFSRSRGGLACAGVSFGALVVATRYHGRRTGSSMPTRLPAALAAMVVAWAAYIGLDVAIERFPALLTGGGSATHRSALWADTVSLIRDFPLFGSGLGTYPHAFPVYKTSPVPFSFEHAHSDVLEAFAEGGLVGLALMIWAIARFGFRVARAIPHLGSMAGLVVCALSAGIAGMLCHSLIDFGLQIPGNVFALLLLGALAVRVAEQPNLVSGRQHGRPRPARTPRA